MQKFYKFQQGRVIVVVHFGKFKGKYPVYMNETAFRVDHPKTPIIRPWYTGEAGSWVEGNDGCIAQVMQVTIVTNKNKQQTRIYRVPWSSFGAYVRKCDGQVKTQLTYFQKRGTSKASMGSKETQAYGKHMNAKKKHFAVLVYELNMAPFRAYMRAFDTYSRKRAHALSRRLMKNEGEALKATVDLTIQEIMNSAGLSLEASVLRLKELTEQNVNHSAKLNAIKTAIELHQHGQIRKPGHNTQVNVAFPPPSGAPDSALPGGRKISAPRLAGHVVEAESVDVPPEPEPTSLDKAFERSREKLKELQDLRSLDD